MRKDCLPENLPIRNADHTFLVNLMLHDGLQELWKELEWTFFRPGTPANDEYEVILVKFPASMPQPWMVTAFPTDYLGNVEAMLKHRGWKLVGGVPVLLDGRGAMLEAFPIKDSPNVHTVHLATPSIGVIVGPQE